jgi:hypothetical protein
MICISNTTGGDPMPETSPSETFRSHIAHLLEELKYDEALPILWDLSENNPSDRELRIYRLLLLRILVLHWNLSRTATGAATDSRIIPNSQARRLSTDPKNSMIWSKRTSVWRTRCASWVSSVSDSLFSSGNRVFKSLKTNLPRAPETGWKRYALVTFLLVSVTLETLFLGNLLQAPNYILRPRTTLNDAVDAMFVRIKREPITISTADKRKEQATLVEPISARRKAPELNARPRAPVQQLRSPATSKNQPETSQWTAIGTARRSSSLVRTAQEVSTGPKKQTVLAAVKAPSVSEPIVVSTRNIDNNPAKIQLNIKWEN